MLDPISIVLIVAFVLVVIGWLFFSQQILNFFGVDTDDMFHFPE